MAKKSAVVILENGVRGGDWTVGGRGQWSPAVPVACEAQQGQAHSSP